jgi:tetratricopeptide (TPR) repeat protein
MASEERPEETKKEKAKRNRLEKLFEHAQKMVSALKPDYEYAAELLSQCAAGEPGNIEYVKAYLENLYKKYNNNHTGATLAQFKKRAERHAVQKALENQQWDEVIKHGVEVLKVNPWDSPALTAMATAAKKSGHLECELLYLKSALLGNPKDTSLNRLVAIALGERLQYDQAMAYWRRVEEALPDDEEPRRAISYLQTQKMRQSGDTFEEEEDEVLKKYHKLNAEKKPLEELTVEKKLLQNIAKNPKQLSLYFELAQYYIREDQFDKAKETYAKAYEISNGDPDVREKWEDAQLRHFKQTITKTADPEKKNKLLQELYQKELEFFKKRCERYPSNLFFRFDLGCRYMQTKQYNEAIREFQLSRNDPRRKGVSLLALGKCFQQIEQYRLAMSNYEMAVEEISDRDADNKKEALRLAGRLALFLDDLDAAEKHLSILAAMDFTYKDVSALLDKLTQARKNQLSKDEEPNPDDEEEEPPDE